MMDKFEESVKDLEQSILEDMKTLHSEKTIEHFLNPRNLGRITTPDGFASVTDAHGHTMEISLKVKDGKVMNASFWTDGCGCSIASGSVVTELAKGKGVLDARKIRQQDIVNALGGLPADDLHCAVLAADTLKQAIKDYLASNREPWKRAYRRGRTCE